MDATTTTTTTTTTSQAAERAQAAAVAATLKELQEKVTQHRATFNTLLAQLQAQRQRQRQEAATATSPPRSLAGSAHQALATSTAAFRLLTTSCTPAGSSAMSRNMPPPALPSPAAWCVLPSLLAEQRVRATIADAHRACGSEGDGERNPDGSGTIAMVGPLLDVAAAQEQVARARAQLEDAQALRSALRLRTTALEQEQRQQQRQRHGAATAQQLYEEKAARLRADKSRWETKSRGIMRVLRRFVEEHLGPMLAAEDMGGPIVGDMLKVDMDVLAAGGFTGLGRPRKPSAMDPDKRQRRIDQMWSVQETTPEMATSKQHNEASAAAADMTKLLEELLSKSYEAGNSPMDAFVTVARETSAVRFLVRCKVAQFHPRDARKMRLLDFGHELT